MIRPQRRVHRAAVLVLAILIPAILIVAWSAHRQPATMDEIPAELIPKTHP